MGPWKWLFLGLLIILGWSEGRRMCYICDTATSKLECLYTPENITLNENITEPTQMPCRHFCTIRRQEYINIPSSVAILSLKRNCEETPEILDGIVVSDYFITYYRSCRSHLCNDGDGTQSLRHLPEDPDEDYEEDGAISHKFPCSNLSLLMLIILYFFHVVAIQILP